MVVVMVVVMVVPAAATSAAAVASPSAAAVASPSAAAAAAPRHRRRHLVREAARVAVRAHLPRGEHAAHDAAAARRPARLLAVHCFGWQTKVKVPFCLSSVVRQTRCFAVVTSLRIEGSLMPRV
jgi:hypothetical protein